MDQPERPSTAAKASSKPPRAADGEYRYSYRLWADRPSASSEESKAERSPADGVRTQRRPTGCLSHRRGTRRSARSPSIQTMAPVGSCCGRRPSCLPHGESPQARGAGRRVPSNACRCPPHVRCVGANAHHRHRSTIGWATKSGANRVDKAHSTGRSLRRSRRTASNAQKKGAPPPTLIPGW